MGYVSMARLSFRCDEALVQRVDAERGLIPREAWLRRAVEQALGKGGPTRAGGEHAADPNFGRSLSAPAERPVPVRSSRQAKDFKPYPKKAR